MANGDAVLGQFTQGMEEKKVDATKKLRVGIIGTGWIAEAHMEQYKKFPDVEMVAMADLIPGKAQAFCEKMGVDYSNIHFYPDHQSMLDNEQLDAVSICTYNATHAQCAIAALKAGVNVLLEKPFTVTLDEAVEVMKAEKESGKLLTIGFQPRMDPNMQEIKKIVESGELGEIYYIQTGGGRRRGIPGRTFVQKDLAGVGCLADIGCYGLDMALNAVGYRKPVTVSAYASDYFGKNPEYYDPVKGGGEFSVDDFTCALIRFEDGLVMDFRMSWAMHMDTMGDTLFLGTKAGLKVKSPHPEVNWGGAWDGGVGDIYLYKDIDGNQVEVKIPKKNEDNKKSFFFLKCRDFCDAILNNGASPIPWQEIIYNQAIIDGIIRSSACGHEVEVNVPEI